MGDVNIYIDQAFQEANEWLLAAEEDMSDEELSNVTHCVPSEEEIDEIVNSERYSMTL